MISSTYMSFFKAHYCILLDIVISSPILGSLESFASRRSHKKRIMLFRASARLQVQCDLCSQKNKFRTFHLELPFVKKSYFTHQFLPLFKRVESRIRCFKRFQISRFLVYSTPSLDTQLISQLSVQPSQVTVRALQPWAEYHPKQMRTKRMSIMMKCMTLRPAQGEKM